MARSVPSPAGPITPESSIPPDDRLNVVPTSRLTSLPPLAALWLLPSPFCLLPSAFCLLPSSDRSDIRSGVKGIRIFPHGFCTPRLETRALPDRSIFRLSSGCRQVVVRFPKEARLTTTGYPAKRIATRSDIASLACSFCDLDCSTEFKDCTTMSAYCESGR
ncbi:Uncharacterised protein [Klebsiella pneumoniae]|nr:Uncharacterised protein [Klebsiella pneumoniae]SXM35220.1 Uncharacterised protein [Klebsiella pneumoniae]SXN50177.1 Uncharacterised protein [Klebsiella pneumoniae]